MWKRWWTWIFVCVLMILIISLGWYLFMKEASHSGGTLVRISNGVWKNV